MAYAVSEYRAQRSKAGLGMSLLVNGGAIAALILFPSAVIIKQVEETWKPDPLTVMPLPPPPPETAPQPETNPNTVKQPEPEVTNPRPLVETPVDLTKNPGFGRTISNTGNIGPTIDIGSGVEFPIPAKKPDPVFVGPSLNQRYASGFQPRYPSGLRRQGISGDVKVKVLVGTDGRVKQVQELDAAHPDFLKATRRQALEKWRFIPATEDGRKVEAWFTVSVKFELDD